MCPAVSLSGRHTGLRVARRQKAGPLTVNRNKTKGSDTKGLWGFHCPCLLRTPRRSGCNGSLRPHPPSRLSAAETWGTVAGA